LAYRYVILTAFYCIGIFLTSADPYPPFEDIAIPHKDKIAHAVLYGGLTLSVSFGIRRSGRRVPAWEQVLVPFLFAVAYGASDELHQLYVPNRYCDIWDLAADAAGAAGAQIFCCGFLWRVHAAKG
jgi:VanZ family protein